MKRFADVLCVLRVSFYRFMYVNYYIEIVKVCPPISRPPPSLSNSSSTERSIFLWAMPHLLAIDRTPNVPSLSSSDEPS